MPNLFLGLNGFSNISSSVSCPGLVFLLLPIRYLHVLKRHCHPWAFFSQPEPTHLSQTFLALMVPALKHFRSPSLDLFQYWMSSAAPQGWAEEINHLLWLLLLLFYQCMLLEIFSFSSRARGWFMFSLASTSTRVLSAELLNLRVTLLCQRDAGKWIISRVVLLFPFKHSPLGQSCVELPWHGCTLRGLWHPWAVMSQMLLPSSSRSEWMGFCHLCKREVWLSLVLASHEAAASTQSLHEAELWEQGSSASPAQPF